MLCGDKRMRATETAPINIMRANTQCAYFTNTFSRYEPTATI